MHDNPTANHSADEAGARDVYQQFMDAWNQGSGTALAAVFTEDGDLVGFDGTHFKGRQQIAPFHQQLFDKWLKGSRLVAPPIGPPSRLPYGRRNGPRRGS